MSSGGAEPAHVYKFFTSYYGRKGLPVRRCLGITPVVPKDYRGQVDRRLAPSTSLAKQIRTLPGREWRESYYALLGQKITPIDAAKLVDGRILLAHETPEEKSHRHMIRGWLEFHGIVVESAEWGGESTDEIDQKSFGFAFGRGPMNQGEIE